MGKSQCTVRAVNDVFGEPCFGTTKHLAAHIVCGGQSSHPPPIKRQSSPICLPSPHKEDCADRDLALRRDQSGATEWGRPVTP
eukprot:SAG25_NODE_1048_length_4180_cov_2.396962_5_plen_83_part_00